MKTCAVVQNFLTCVVVHFARETSVNGHIKTGFPQSGNIRRTEKCQRILKSQRKPQNVRKNGGSVKGKLSSHLVLISR